VSDRDYWYSAKQAYQEGSSRRDYETRRFSGFAGRYRHRREFAAVTSLLDTLPGDLTMADCPCGSGRWWPVLARRASRIIALDVSKGMIEHAREEATRSSVEVEVREGDAENLPLEDASVDYTFSFALTKHLPIPVQYVALAEFARVARRGVLSTFSVFSHLTYEVWRRRGLAESYGVFPEQLEWMASEAGLKIEAMKKCTTPIGVERIVLFSKK
jgi:ubiquinone/menaquinone biosynthesis C-methylase UbiE